MNNINSTVAPIEVQVGPGGIDLQMGEQWLRSLSPAAARRAAEDLRQGIAAMTISEHRSGQSMAFDTVENAAAAAAILDDAATSVASAGVGDRPTLVFSGNDGRHLAYQLRYGASFVLKISHGHNPDESYTTGYCWTHMFEKKGDTWSWAPDRKKPRNLTHYEVLGRFELVSHDTRTGSALLAELID